jgi:hypothetical protein
LTTAAAKWERTRMKRTLRLLRIVLIACVAYGVIDQLPC